MGFRHKMQVCKKNFKKKKKKQTGRYIDNISANICRYISDISTSLFFYFFFIFDLMTVVLGHVEG